MTTALYGNLVGYEHRPCPCDRDLGNSKRADQRDQSGGIRQGCQVYSVGYSILHYSISITSVPSSLPFLFLILVDTLGCLCACTWQPDKVRGSSGSHNPKITVLPLDQVARVVEPKKCPGNKPVAKYPVYVGQATANAKRGKEKQRRRKVSSPKLNKGQ